MGQFWNDLKAQKLPGNYPFPSANTVFPVTFSTAILCILMGFSIQISNLFVRELDIPYANELCDCSKDVIEKRFFIKENWKGPITLFYRIEGFHMNHRKFRKSKCKQQLEGSAINDSDIHEDCYAWDGHFNVSTIEWADMHDEKGRFRAPIGSWANAMFNDTFELSFESTNYNRKRIVVPLSTEGILTRVEKMFYVNNTNCSDLMYFNRSKPRNWPKPMCEFENGYQNVDFVVWMRWEANNAFKKMYRYISQEGEFHEGLPAGFYSMRIQNNWARCDFKIKKSFVLFKPSWYGHKDTLFFYVCYAVGIIYLIVGSAMYVRHKKRGKTFEEVAELKEDDE